MAEFRNMLSLCELKDMGFQGTPLTWCNNRGGSDRIYECLDRCVATLDWIGLFPKAIVKHDSVANSNHIPIWLDIEGGRVLSKGNKLFRFETMWLDDNACKEIVDDVWHYTIFQCNLDQLSKSI